MIADDFAAIAKAMRSDPVGGPTLQADAPRSECQHIYWQTTPDGNRCKACNIHWNDWPKRGYHG